MKSETAVIVLSALLGAAGALGGSFIGGSMAMRASEQQAASSARAAERAEVQRAMGEYAQALDGLIDVMISMESAGGTADREAYEMKVEEIRQDSSASADQASRTLVSVQLVAPRRASDAALTAYNQFIRKLNVQNDLLDIKGAFQRDPEPNYLNELTPNAAELVKVRDNMMSVFREVLEEL